MKEEKDLCALNNRQSGLMNLWIICH